MNDRGSFEWEDGSTVLYELATGEPNDGGVQQGKTVPRSSLSPLSPGTMSLF